MGIPLAADLRGSRGTDPCVRVHLTHVDARTRLTQLYIMGRIDHTLIMSKRTVLAALTLLVGGLTSLSTAGVAVGAPLLLVGGYGLFGPHLSMARVKRIASLRA